MIIYNKYYSNIYIWKNSKKITFFSLKTPSSDAKKRRPATQNYPELSIIFNAFKCAHDRCYIRPNFPKKIILIVYREEFFSQFIFWNFAMSEAGTGVVLGAGWVECCPFVARFAPSYLQRILLPGGRVRVLDSPPQNLPWYWKWTLTRTWTWLYKLKKVVLTQQAY